MERPTRWIYNGRVTATDEVAFEQLKKELENQGFKADSEWKDSQFRFVSNTGKSRIIFMLNGTIFLEQDNAHRAELAELLRQALAKTAAADDGARRQSSIVRCSVM